MPDSIVLSAFTYRYAGVCRISWKPGCIFARMTLTVDADFACISPRVLLRLGRLHQAVNVIPIGGPWRMCLLVRFHLCRLVFRPLANFFSPGITTKKSNFDSTPYSLLKLLLEQQKMPFSKGPGTKNGD